MKAAPLPDQTTLLKLFSYNPQTGDLIRHSFRGKGKPAGTKRPRSINVFVARQQYKAHRIIWKMMTGEDPSDLLDHRNCDPHDNRWVNLRDANNSLNIANSRLRPDNLAGFKGVHMRRDKRTFRAVIECNGKRFNLGDYRTPEEAHAAYKGAATVLFGAYARYRKQPPHKPTLSPPANPVEPPCRGR